MNLKNVVPSKLTISRTAGLFYTPELMQVPLLAGRKYKLAPVTVLFTLAVRRWITHRWSSKLRTLTSELTRGGQDPQIYLYDRKINPSRPKHRMFSLIDFQPQALSTDMPLFRPVNRSDNVSCSNWQRTTAPAKIVVTKKGKERLDQKRSLVQCT